MLGSRGEARKREATADAVVADEETKQVSVERVKEWTSQNSETWDGSIARQAAEERNRFRG